MLHSGDYADLHDKIKKLSHGSASGSICSLRNPPERKEWRKCIISADLGVQVGKFYSSYGYVSEASEHAELLGISIEMMCAGSLKRYGHGGMLWQTEWCLLDKRRWEIFSSDERLVGGSCERPAKESNSEEHSRGNT